MRLWTRSGADSSPRAAVSTPTVLVMTLARDEASNLPRWLSHYGPQVGLENILILDDNSVDGSTDDLECTVHRLPELPGGKEFEAARMVLVSGIAAGMLAAYNIVVFVDADEFLVPDPDRYEGLAHYLVESGDREVIAPMTLNVVHHVEAEGPLDPSLPIIGQRRFAKFVPVMCKPCIKRVPARWRAASHGIMAPFEVDPGLFMLHLKYHDLDTAVRVAEHRRRLVDSDGRAAGTTWAAGGEQLGEELPSYTAGIDPAGVAEFSPAEADLSAIVREMENGVFRAVGYGQQRAMTETPLWRIPERLIGLV